MRRDQLSPFDLRPFAAVALTLLASACAPAPGSAIQIVDAPEARPLTVMTASGPVMGVQARAGEVFLGIPFAAPPVGDLRLRSPQPPQSWTAVRDATKPGPQCIQAGLPVMGAQSEDCLTLNIYAPTNAFKGADLPVMVWLYGGGFTFGSNKMYDPHRLASSQNVIVVAPNYRLGAFGFMAHPALRGSGEGAFALQDQQAALKWVRDNIAAFGGNPANVTLFGESAGAWSTCSQMASPAAAGLFQRAILQSGPCVSGDSVIAMDDAEAGGLRLAESVGCKDIDTAQACLRKLPAGKLRNAKAMRRGLLGPDSWTPAFGGDVLPLPPKKAFAMGAFYPVPVINGTNRDEGRLFLTLNRYMGKLWTRASYENLIREAYPGTGAQVLATYADVAKHSFGRAYADIVTDGTFACPAQRLSERLRPYATVYTYEFDDETAPFSLPRLPGTAPLSAYHSAELSYVFDTRWVLSDPARFRSSQQDLSHRMQMAWGAFAHAGNPGWQNADGRSPYRLGTATAPNSRSFDTEHRCRFWDALEAAQGSAP
jgi:para-nitrobenzyl esterase